MKTTKLLIPIDFTSVTEHAISYATQLFTDQDKELVLLHILTDLKESEAEEKLKALKEKYSDTSVALTYRIEKGKIFDDIGRIAETIDADFVIMGTHDTNRVSKLFGSKAIKVITDSKVPFITIQEESQPRKISRIAMTIDVERESVQVAKTAVSLASYFKSEVVLVGGDHEDPILRHKVISNMKVAITHIKNHGIEASHVFLERDHFMQHFIDYCKAEKIDLIAATYYMNNFQILSAKFVQELLENDLQLPVLTIDAQAEKIGTLFSF